jgi:L-lactate dehydrogenase complex protein LldG
MERVRLALGRTGPLTTAPTPPAIDESIARLADGDGLADRFIRMCEENKMHVERTTAEDLPSRLADFLRSQNVHRVALSSGGVMQSITSALRQSGFDVRSWDETTLDDLYDFDCGITDVYSAVAETGSLVIRASTAHGRALSLVPPIHVAVVEQGQIVPDLIDLFAKLTREGTGSAVSLITGPSKTSDIEMILVVGVHGPVKVQIFLM